ncbi:Protein of unknown function DUF541 [Penicillium sp. IBT 31633x]|nr:Protein of unknown function DUF541 [Penicillium sp. IBT 31633x]
MPPLKILVTGKSSIKRAPERGTIKFSIKSNGSDQGALAQEVTGKSTELQTWFKATFYTCSDESTEAPMTEFSSTRIKTWTKSTDRHDNPVPNPHHASISFKAVFRDFSKLNYALGELMSYWTVEIDSLQWNLTDETGTKLASEARKLALRDAIQQANDYSEVLGREVAVVEIADQGSSPYRATRYMAAAGVEDYSRRESAPLDLTPQDVDIEGNVSVTFENT